MTKLHQQIAELPDDCEMFRQVTELDPLAVVPVGFTSQELKALINELTEKVERAERSKCEFAQTMVEALDVFVQDSEALGMRLPETSYRQVEEMRAIVSTAFESLSK